MRYTVKDEEPEKPEETEEEGLARVHHSQLTVTKRLY